MAEKEYIERGALIAEIEGNIDTFWNEGCGGYYLAEDALKYSVKTAPTADVVEVKHGYWKFNSDGSGTCSECHFTQRGVWDYDNHQHYCGVCGARMDGGNKNE